MKEVVDSATTRVSPKDHTVPTEWQVTGLIVLVASLCVIGLFWATVRSMVEIWASDRTFSHGLLVLPTTCYLIWCYREKLIPLVPTPSARGVAALILVGSGWVVGHLTNLLWLQQAAVVALLPSLVWAILGTEIVRTLFWPLGFLMFLVPVGTSIEPWLQDFTARFILVGLRASGIPYLYEDYRVTIPSGTWEISRGCAGLRYLLPGLALGYAFTTLIYRRPSRRVTFLAICAVVLMVANGVRAYGLIVGDHLGIADGTDHRVFSYTIYGLAMPLLFWLGLKWKQCESPVALPFSRPARSFDHRKVILASLRAVGLLMLVRLTVWLLPASP
jgi:exosortase A